MIVVAVVLCCLGLFILLCKHLEDVVHRVVKWQRKSHERISTLEVNDFAQDARLDNQQKHIKRLREDVKEMGKDIGWTDDDRKTQVMKTKDPTDPE